MLVFRYALAIEAYLADHPHVEQGALAIEAYLVDRPHVEHGGQSIIIDNIHLKEIL